MQIKVFVRPNSKEEELEKLGYDEYVAKVREPAEKGKANVALLKLLKKHFKGKIKIIHGFSDRDKIIEIC
jgi:uncharacterized protein (TIGR00251 family)